MKLKRLKKIGRNLLVFTMAFLVGTSTLATAFATYGLIPYNPNDQKVNVEHIWVDKNNEDQKRPDEVEAEVTAKDKDDQQIDIAKTPEDGSKPANDAFKDKDTLTDDGSTAGKEAGANAADNDLKNLEEGQDTLNPTNPGNDKGFEGGYKEGYDQAVEDHNQDRDEDEDEVKVEWPKDEPGEGEEPKPGEGEEPKPGEGEEPKPGEGEEPKPGEGEEPKPGEGEEPKPGEGEEPKPEKPSVSQASEAVKNAEKVFEDTPKMYDYEYESLKQYENEVEELKQKLEDLRAQENPDEWELKNAESNLEYYEGKVEYYTNKKTAYESALKDLDDARKTLAEVAIDEVIKAPSTDGIVPDGKLDKDAVDGITDELLDKVDEDGNAVKDQGNVWHESEDYVAKVEDKAGVTYEVELPQGTKDALKEAGYDSVQLKITYDVIYQLTEDGNAKWSDSDKKIPVLVKRVFVSYDNGTNWEKPDNVYLSKDGGVTWEDRGEGDLGQEWDEDAEKILNSGYDSKRDYVKETTYTFLHVKGDAPDDPPKNPPDDPGPDPKPGRDPDPDPDPDPEDPPVDIDEPDVPLAPPPEIPEEPPVEEPPVVEIPEIPTPLAPLPPVYVPPVPVTPVPVVEIPEVAVPLSDVPKTGDESGVWTTMALLASAGLLGLVLTSRKKAEEN